MYYVRYTIVSPPGEGGSFQKDTFVYSESSLTNFLKRLDFFEVYDVDFYEVTQSVSYDTIEDATTLRGLQ